jgi:SAM-dependent methyltransferase
VKRTTGARLNRLPHPDAWQDPEWVEVGRRLALPQLDMPEHPGWYHRKAWEWIQCVYGLERLDALGPAVRVLGVGAGHEPVLFYLANHSALTVATDLYGGDFTDAIAAEADPGFLRDPSQYAPFEYARDRLVALPADGRRLPFAGGSFDVVYSLSSIEHFGGHDMAAMAMAEMGRVLRPGGICCVATELILEGGTHGEYFTREELDVWIIGPSGLVLVEPLDDTPPPRRYIDDPVPIPENPLKTPHLVLATGDLRWTSVMLFLRKPTGPLSRLSGRLANRRRTRASRRP